MLIEKETNKAFIIKCFCKNIIKQSKFESSIVKCTECGTSGIIDKQTKVIDTKSINLKYISLGINDNKVFF